MVEERPGQPSPKNVQHYVELGRKILVETKITGDVSQDNFIKGFPPCSVQRSPLSLVESFIVLLRQQEAAWASCSLLVLDGIRLLAPATPRNSSRHGVETGEPLVLF